MFNPFPRYDSKFLPAFRQKKITCFVLQTYLRGKTDLSDENAKAFLLTHYTDLGLALEHMDSLKHDAGARIIHLNDPHDLKELDQFGDPGTAVPVYMRFKSADAETKARKLYDKKLRAYINFKLDWKIPGYEVVQFSLDFIFGDIYVELKHGSKYHKVKIEEIETMSGYVL